MAEISHRSDVACSECGRFGAYAFDGECLCVDCYQARGSCCAERTIGLDDGPVKAAGAIGERCASPDRTGSTALLTVGQVTCEPAGDHHRVSANCCYEACPGCSYVKKLREFQARHPHDWRERLRGLPRIVAKAQARAG